MNALAETRGGSRISRRVAGLIVLTLTSVVVAGWAWFSWPFASAEELLDLARQLRRDGDAAGAEATALRAVKVEPQLHIASLVAAESAVAQQRYREAVQYVTGIPETEQTLRVPRGILLAVVNHRYLLRFAEAERAYRTVLEFEPDNVEANQGLADLLLQCARKQEAVTPILRLIRQKQHGDYLIALAKPGTVMFEEGLLEQARAAAPDDPTPLLGLAWQVVERGDLNSGINLLEEALKLRPGYAPALAALGELYAKADRIDDLQRWSESLPQDASDFPQTWIAKGILADRRKLPAEAAVCYAQAARLAPEMKMPNVQLARLLALLGLDEEAARFERRVLILEALDNKQNQFDHAPEFLLELIAAYEEAGRIWEAYGFSQAAAELDQPGSALWNKYQELEERSRSLDFTLTTDTANEALRLNLEWISSSSGGLKAPTTGNPDATLPRRFTFVDSTESSGLNFRYFNGVTGPTQHRMFEFTAGGIGVLDMDVDGWPDLFLTQGQFWPPQKSEKQLVDTVFRNRQGKQFQNVSVQTEINEIGFGQGIAVGDVNADGFPDVFVGNLGENALWMNNGDGTFADFSGASGVAGPSAWTTSCAIADLTGDSLPDIYEVNYLSGPDLLTRVCNLEDGSERQCLPFEFSAEPDRVLVNQGNSVFQDGTKQVLPWQENGKGLGIALWDASEQGRLNILVANDTTPNFFFAPVQDRNQPCLYEEIGITSGIALNADGKSEGCMGIALADIDMNGYLDAHITNFYHESNRLYAALTPRVFEDITQQAGLIAQTMELLGFGTQFLDADRDGRFELFVANGHVDDLSRLGKPYRMRSQFFRWNGSGFQEIASEQLGGYFQKEWIGRSVARTDWNRDGRDDLVIGNLHYPTVLLTNATPPAGQVFSLRLVGTVSARDPIGATAQVLTQEATMKQQLTAGDGYHASNQRVLSFATGNAAVISQLRIRWPSGRVQEFVDLPPAGNFVLVEGQAWFGISP